MALFSQKGYAATNVVQIAEDAGIGKGTIYEYYETKADIFVAAMCEWMDQFEDQLAGYIDGIDDPVERLGAYAKMNMDLVDPIDPGNARLFMEFLQQSMLVDGALYNRHHLMKEMHSGQLKIVVDILLDGISKGVFRPGIARDAEKIALNLMAYLDGISLHAILSDNYFKIKDQIEYYLENLFKSILMNSDTKNTSLAV